MQKYITRMGQNTGTSVASVNVRRIETTVALVADNLWNHPVSQRMYNSGGKVGSGQNANLTRNPTPVTSEQKA